MSAWFVWSALGIYPIPSTDRYIVGTPLFPHAEIHLAGGTVTIDANGVSDENVYVKSATLNGKPLEKAEILHSDLVNGGALVFEMGPEPTDWARRE